MRSLFDIVLRNLHLIRSRNPSTSEAQLWVDEFARQIGTVDAERLEAAFVSARETAAGTPRHRPLVFDDILLHYRRTNPTGQGPDDRPPTDPHCSRRCGDGKVTIMEGDYEVLALCDCAAGQWWSGQAGWSSYPGVSDLLSRPGYSEKQERRISQAQGDWLRDRTGQVGIKQAMQEFQAEMQRRAEG